MRENSSRVIDSIIKNEPAEAVEAFQDLVRERAEEIILHIQNPEWDTGDDE